MKKIVSRVFYPTILLLIVFISLPVLFIKASAEEKRFVSTRAELMKALSDKQDVIYVGDIDFDEKDIYISISRSVKIVGKDEGSHLKHATFLIEGPEVESELITVSFENIIFDGCYEAPEGNPNEALSFTDFHGGRDGKGCFTVKGYIDLNFSGCTIKNYCTKYGAAMYLQYTDGNEDLGNRAKLTMKNCFFTGNICERGVFWCNGKKTKLEIEDCTFSGNNAYSGILVLGGIIGTLERVTVKDNNRVIFKEKNSFTAGGGGMALANSEAVIKDCLIEGNSAPYGGGILSTTTKLIIADCKVLNNSADTFGGGIVLQSREDTPVYVTNCLFSGNKAAEEGAVWVYPADQIGIGVPTGITEFSFCTFENNLSDDNEHFIFHPIMTENAESTVGADGKIDFIACRINDLKVSAELNDGGNFNIVNSDRKGEQIPDDILNEIANGYYEGTGRKMYPGMNKIEDSKDNNAGTSSDRQKAVIIICAVSLVLLCAVFFVIISNKKKNNSGDVIEKIKCEKDLNSGSEKNVETGLLNSDKKNISTVEDSKVSLDDLLKILAKEKSLTERETDVLREYLAGKNRSEISRALFISESTVKNHISNIFSKTGVKNKTELLKIINGE